MRNSLGFRGWYYFRQGWTTYFAFIMAAINTLTVTYFLAIERYPIFTEIFPSFIHYIVIASLIGIPLLVAAGYLHYKKTSAYSSEADIVAETNPYSYKLPPGGWNQVVTFPLYLMITKMMIKLSKNEKFSDEEIVQIIELQKKIQVLIDGGFINNPREK